MTSILGISAFYHDSAASLIIDGDIIAAAQEERFSRKKHDPRYPFNAVNYVLSEGKIKLSEIDQIDEDESDSSWLYGKRKPKHSRKGYTNQGRLIPGLGFGHE